MSSSIKEEIHRLVRKVSERLNTWQCAMTINVEKECGDNYVQVGEDYWEPRARNNAIRIDDVPEDESLKAIHAALLVLAGELDVPALVAERDFYRNEVIAYERAACIAPPRDAEENP